MGGEVWVYILVLITLLIIVIGIINSRKQRKIDVERRKRFYYNQPAGYDVNFREEREKKKKR